MDVADGRDAGRDAALVDGAHEAGDGANGGVPDGDVPDAGGDDAAVMLANRALLDALRRDAESTMTPLGYDAARDAMYAVGGVDDNGGRIEGIYTGRTVDTDGTRVPGSDCALADGTPTTCAFNTEHTFARVHLRDAFGEGTPEYDASEGDIHHLFPSDELANNARANFDFGETDCAAAGNCAFEEESRLGLPIGGMGPTNCPIGVDVGEDLCVMQVRPARRGDVARAIFYMSMRWDLALSVAVETSLRAWSVADPPDAWERGRNDRAALAQGNRNPFVDDPGLIARIADF